MFSYRNPIKMIIKILCALLLLLPLVAKAERADSLKRVNAEYGEVHVEYATGTTIATGKVVLTRGTTVLKSERAEVTEAPDGFRKFVLIAKPGELATFRTKSDGGPDLWSEGHAERIEYDERTETVKLFSKAMIRQLEGNRITHQMEQAFISYDSRNEVLLGQNDPSGNNTPVKGRGTMTFEPFRPLTTTASQTPAGK
jgi:lipopolysaccharide export system protein LptA